MTKNIILDEMESVLKVQITLMEQIHQLQRTVYKSVINRDWEETEKGMQNLDDLSKKFSIADQKLVRLLPYSSDNANENLSDYIASLPTSDRQKITVLYNTLKEKTFLSKIENDILNTYLEHARSLVSGIFDAVSEERYGQTYTNTGARADNDLSNVLVDRVF